MQRPSEKFKCMACGSESTRAEKSEFDKSHGVNRCKPCYTTWHKADIVKRAKNEKAAFEEKRRAQKEERKAKAEKFADDLSKQAAPKENQYSSKQAVINKARRDKMEAEKEVELINKEYE